MQGSFIVMPTGLFGKLAIFYSEFSGDQIKQLSFDLMTWKINMSNSILTFSLVCMGQ
jgi:hypothetical protein